MNKTIIVLLLVALSLSFVSANKVEDLTAFSAGTNAAGVGSDLNNIGGGGSEWTATSSYNIANISVNLKLDGTPTKDYVMDLYTVNANLPDTKIATSNRFDPTVVGVAYGLHNFSFNATPITNGVRYMYGIRYFDDTNNTNNKIVTGGLFNGAATGYYLVRKNDLGVWSTWSTNWGIYIQVWEDVTPAPGLNNFTTIKTSHTYFNTTASIGATYGTVSSANFEVLNTAETYFSSSLSIEGGTGTAECRINVGGVYYDSTAQRSLSGDIGAMYLLTNLTTLTSNNYTVSLECRKIGGNNFNVLQSEISNFQLYDKNQNIATGGEYKTIVSAPLNTNPSKIYNTTYTTSNNFNASQTNNLSLFVLWAADYEYGTIDGLINTTIELNGKNCTSYPRTGSATSTGSVVGSCLISELTNDTTYNLSVWGDTTSTNAALSAKIIISELIQTNSSANTSSIPQKTFTANKLLDSITIANPLGGSFNAFIIGSLNLQNTSSNNTEGEFYLTVDGVRTEETRNRTFSGIGNIGLEHVASLNGVATKNISLYGTCSSQCELLSGDLTAFVTDASSSTDNQFTITAWDVYNSTQIQVFNVTINNVIFPTTNGSIVVPGSGITTTTITANKYFSNTTSHDTTTNLNATLYYYTAIYAQFFDTTTINNFSITYNNTNYTTTNGVIYINLYSTTEEITIFNAQEGSTTYNTESVNITANPFLKNYTFTLFLSNTFNITFYNETNNLLLNNTIISWEIISSLEVRNGTTSNGSVIESLLTPGSYEIVYYQNINVPRSYYVTLTNQSSKDIRLYVIDESIADTYTLVVQDQSNTRCADQTVSLLRYYIDINGYRTVQMAKTNTLGDGYFFLKPVTVPYKFSFTGSCGNFVSSPTQIIQASDTYIVTDAQSYLSSFVGIEDLLYNLTYNNVTSTYVFTWSDTTNLVREGCLTVTKAFRGIRSTQYSSCSTSNSGSLIYTINATNETVFYAQGKITTNTEFSNYFTEILEVNNITSYALLGGLGIILTLIVVIGLTLFASTSAVTLSLGAAGGLALMVYMGIIYSSYVAIIGVLILAVVIAVKARSV